MAEVLSQDEINKLLSAIASGEVDTSSPEDQVKIKIYDFKRPEVFSQAQHNTMALLHEQFARDLTNSLTELFQVRTAFHVASVYELTYEEFIRSIPNPGFISTISLAPFPFSCALEIDPPLISALIDLLAGGDGSRISISANQEFSELERLIFTDFFQSIINPFSEMWNTKISLTPELAEIGSNPARVKITSRQAMVFLVTIESVIGKAEGMLNICYPVSFIRLPFMPDQIEKEKKENLNNAKLSNIRCKKHNQFRIGSFSVKELAKFRNEQEISIGKDNVSRPQFTPVIKDKEV